jgi:hypothetical protein
MKAVGKALIWPFTLFLPKRQTAPSLPESRATIKEPAVGAPILTRIKNLAQWAWQGIVGLFKAVVRVVFETAKTVANAVVKTAVRYFKSAAAFIRHFLRRHDFAIKAGKALCLKAEVQTNSVTGLRKPFLKAIPPARSAIQLPAAA